MKKRIYILHGWATSTEKWNSFIDLLKDKNVEPVMLKIPGLTAALDEAWKLEDYVEWLNKIIDKDLSAGRQAKVILLGHSNGGRISLAYAFKYPEKIAKIILIDSAGIYHNEFSIRVKRFVFGAIAKFGKGIKEIKPIRRMFYRLIMESDYEKANPILRKTMQNLIHNDLTQILEKIITPTVIIWGKNDSITPFKDGELMHEKIKNSKLYAIEDARHSPQFSNTKEVVDILTKEI